MNTSQQKSLQIEKPKISTLTKQAILNKKGWFKIAYNDQDQRRPDIDIIPYFFFHPVERYDRKYNKKQSILPNDTQLSNNSNNNPKVKQQHIIQEKTKNLPKLPPLQYLSQNQDQIIFQKRNVTIKVGRKAHLVKVGKILVIANIISTKGFAFCVVKDYFYQKLSLIKMCRKQYKAIVQRIITTVWKKLQRVIRKYCQYNITPFTNQEIRLIYAPIQNMKQKLRADTRETFAKYIKLCFYLGKVTISKQQSITLYKAIRKILHNDPLWIQQKQYQTSLQQNQNTTMPQWMLTGKKKRQKKTNMFHKSHILRHLQNQIETKQYNQLMDEILQQVKTNQQDQEKLQSGKLSLSEAQYRSKQIQQKQTKLHIMKQLQLIASALYYKGFGLSFYLEYLQEVSEQPQPQYTQIQSSQYNKYAKIVMRKLFQNIQSQIKKQGKNIVQFNGDQQKQVLMIMLNYTMSINVKARSILQSYLVKLFGIQLEQGLVIDKISGNDSMFLYKSILQEVNVKTQVSYLKSKSKNNQTSQKKKVRNNKQNNNSNNKQSQFNDDDMLFNDQNTTNKQFKRQLKQENTFLRSKGLSIDQFQTSLIKLFLDQKQIKKIVKLMNTRYPKGEQFTTQMIINKISDLLYKGILKTDNQRTKFNASQLPEFDIPTQEECKTMVLSSNGYMLLKVNIFKHILKEQHFDVNTLYLVINTIKEGYDKLRIEINKSQKLQCRREQKIEMEQINRQNEQLQQERNKKKSLLLKKYNNSNSKIEKKINRKEYRNHQQYENQKNKQYINQQQYEQFQPFELSKQNQNQ